MKAKTFCFLLLLNGLILAQANKVVFSPNLRAVEGIPLKDELEPKIGMPLTVENDGNAAACTGFEPARRP